MLGTAYYMAPEIITSSKMVQLKPRNEKKGKNKGHHRRNSSLISQLTGNVLYATDVWALGVIVYLMIAKKIPFTGIDNDKIFHSIVKYVVVVVVVLLIFCLLCVLSYFF